MNAILNLVIDLFAEVVNVAVIRWPELTTTGILPESKLERRKRKAIAITFFSALVVIPLIVTGWILW